MAVNVEQVIDLDRYPIHRQGPERAALVASVQSEIRSVGCAVIKQFVKQSAIPSLVAESDSVAHLG
ncbi:MAG: hypothetical protein EBZ54_03030, partial [Actinobacteria bacterium]|nr:hypothetical protein [Actinomycetota bacterium]